MPVAPSVDPTTAPAAGAAASLSTDAGTAGAAAVGETVAPSASAAAAPASTEPTTPPVAQKSDAARAASFAQREANLQKTARELKAQRAEIEGVQKQAKEFEELRGLASTDPLKVLERLGLTYDQVTEHRLKAGAVVDPDAPLKRGDLEAFKQEQATKAEAERKAAEKAEADRLAAEVEETTKQYRAKLTDFVATNESKYPNFAKGFALTGHDSPASLMYQVIVDHHAASKVVLTPDQAADLIERWFIAQVTALPATQQVSAKRAPEGTTVEPKATASESPTAQVADKPPRSLSNALGVTAAAAAEDAAAAEKRPMTEKERLDAAVALYNSRAKVRATS